LASLRFLGPGGPVCWECDQSSKAPKAVAPAGHQNAAANKIAAAEAPGGPGGPSGGGVTTKSAHGPKGYHVHGFSRSDDGVRVSIIVDVDTNTGGEAFELAQAIGGPDYCFHASENLLHPVPDTVKNRLLTNDELYAAVPELDLSRRRRARAQR
jgi:hypothetical protein